MSSQDALLTIICSLVAGVIIVVVLTIVDVKLEYEYHQGQIDALTGKIQYELKVNPDSTRTWEKTK